MEKEEEWGTGVGRGESGGEGVRSGGGRVAGRGPLLLTLVEETALLQ